MGQAACLNSGVMETLLSQLNESDAQLRRWSIIGISLFFLQNYSSANHIHFFIIFYSFIHTALGRLWDGFDEAKVRAMSSSIKAVEKICILLQEPSPEVRAAVLSALGSFIGGADNDDVRASVELNIGLTMMVALADASPLVRKELVISLSRLIGVYRVNFAAVAAAPSHNVEAGSIYSVIWSPVATQLTQDPHLEVLSLVNALVISLGEVSRTLSSSSSSASAAAKQKGSPLQLSQRHSTQLSPQLVSRYYEWSSEYFQHQLLEDDEDDRTSPMQKEKRERQKTAAAVIKDASSSYEIFDRQKRFRRNVGLFDKSNENEIPGQVAFSSFDTTMVTCNEKDGIRCEKMCLFGDLYYFPFHSIVIIIYSICKKNFFYRVWDWASSRLVNFFNNMNAINSRITSISFITELDRPLLLVGSSIHFISFLKEQPYFIHFQYFNF